MRIGHFPESCSPDDNRVGLDSRIDRRKHRSRMKMFLAEHSLLSLHSFGPQLIEEAVRSIPEGGLDCCQKTGDEVPLFSAT